MWTRIIKSRSYKRASKACMKMKKKWGHLGRKKHHDMWLKTCSKCGGRLDNEHRCDDIVDNCGMASNNRFVRALREYEALEMLAKLHLDAT